MENLKIALRINAASTFEANQDMPLMWLIRDEAKLKETKFGCGKGTSGACSVRFDGELARSCVYLHKWLMEKRLLPLRVCRRIRMNFTTYSRPGWKCRCLNADIVSPD
ncbi:xanthine dehydrogenase subunit XdhC [Dyadobacter bucti]|uniref:xanthine dehydrogenase subunit XdhC n=1 Tax=Dyadobacter bucti TaxID=2572203 RepID=UPI001E507E3F|nr:xanthine dehydrogenase subunit XdhC [Dyadobacter bucti]